MGKTVLFMDDAIKATVDIMAAKPDTFKIRPSYNLDGISFTPKEIANSTQTYLTDFKTTYKPDLDSKLQIHDLSINYTEAIEQWC